MSNKESKTLTWFFLFFAVLNFLIFAYDIEKDRDFWTWMWLLTSIICFISYLKLYLKK